MIPLTLTLRKGAASYEWGNKEFRINHLLLMDDLKLFAKNQDQIDSLVQTVHLFSEDIGMQFGLNKCGVLVLKRGKIVKQNGITFPNGQMMKEIDESGYKYLGIVEVDKIKEKEMKDKFASEYKRRLKLVLKSKLNGKNKILAIIIIIIIVIIIIIIAIVHSTKYWIKTLSSSVSEPKIVSGPSKFLPCFCLVNSWSVQHFPDYSCRSQ